MPLPLRLGFGRGFSRALVLLVGTAALAGWLGCSAPASTPVDGGGDLRVGSGGSTASATGGTAAGTGPDGATGGAGPSVGGSGGGGRGENGGSDAGGSDAGSGAAATDAGATADVGASTDVGASGGAGGGGRDGGGATDAQPIEAGTGTDAAGGSGGAAVTELIHYYGRWNRLADRAITVNSGSHVAADFAGTGITARFDVTLNQVPNPTLTWRIDQGAWQERELAATLPLATGLPAGAHTVVLMVRGLNELQSRWVPPLISIITFLGLDVAGGALQPSPRPLRPRIEFLGDSITEGINVWPSRPGMDTACWREDGRLAYASQTAQALGAEWRQVGFGRQGLLIGGNGGVPTASNSFNFIYQGVPRDGWQPDLVVINQGTNDGGATAAAFRSAYTTFISTVRAGYPTAKIVALRPFGGLHAAEISAEVTARNAAGDTRVFYIDTTGWLVAADFTDGLHPNVQGSTKAAQALTAAITNRGLL